MSHRLPDGWTAKPLGELFEFKNGFNADKSMYGKGKKFINVMEVINKQSLYEKDIPGQVDIPDDSFSLYSVVKGDVLFNRTSETPDEIGLTAVYLDDQPVTFGGFVIRARPIGKDLDTDFCKYCFSAGAVRKEIIKRGQGAIRANIGQGDLSDVFLQIPSKSEQKKIAKILSTWDEAIEKNRATTEVLTGLKQNLLRQTIYRNQVHHKTGWSLKPVSELFEILDNKRKPLNSTQRQNMQGDIPYYGANGQVGTVADFIFDEPLILLAEDGGYFDEYKTRPIAYRVFGKSWVNNHAHVLKAKTNFSFDYLYFALVHKNIMPFLNGGTRAKLNKAVLEEIEIPIPDKIEEQSSIANLFNSMEKKEILLKKQTALLLKQKQGLMQQLLTGKKRVKV